MKKFLAIIISLILTLTALCAVGCGKKKGSTESNPVINLNGFNTTEDYNTIHLRQYLGKVTKVTSENLDLDDFANLTDEEKESFDKSVFVPEGDACARVQVEHNPFNAALAGYMQSIYQELNLTQKGIDYTDFSFVSDITLDIYNANTEVKEFRVQLVYAILANEEMTTEMAQVYELQPGWNTIRYSVDRAFVPIKNNYSYVKALLFSFNQPERALGKDDIFFLDNIRMYKTTIPFSSETRSLTHRGNVYEMNSFDSLWQVKNMGITEPNYITASWCRDMSSDGVGACLKVDTFPTNNDGFWPNVKLNKSICADTSIVNYLNFDLFDDDDELLFDWYIPGEGVDKISITFYSLYDRGWNGNVPYGPRGQWNTFSVTIGEINNHIEADVNSHKRFARFKEITFSIGRSVPYAATFYLDNIRIIKHGSNAINEG